MTEILKSYIDGLADIARSPRDVSRMQVMRTLVETIELERSYTRQALKGMWDLTVGEVVDRDLAMVRASLAIEMLEIQ